MAIYSTFFVCQRDELTGGFLGWRPPLAKPVQRQVKNLFTGQMTTVETREPDWSDCDEDDGTMPEFQIAAIEGNYLDYLEGRISPFVRALPHYCGKGLTEVELEPLATNMGVEWNSISPLYGPPTLAAILLEIPNQLCTKLAGLDGTGLDAAARKWAVAMSAPEHTHSMTGERLSDGWTAPEAMGLLEPIAALARRAAGKGLYLLNEW